MAHPNLMSLPDAPLYVIFSHLGVSETGGSFQKPRHAFSLAQANARLLRIFSSLLTRITPDLSNPMPPTLSPKHLVATARLAGPALRELHLPAGAFSLLPTLADACPNLEVLFLIEEEEENDSGLTEVLRLPLRSLSIDKPSCDSLRMLVPPPPELSLTNVCKEHLSELESILHEPPRKLRLEIAGAVEVPVIEELLETLRIACPKMEEVRLSIKTPEEQMFPWMDDELQACFAVAASRRIADTRRNAAVSMCKSITLGGLMLFSLVSTAHPDAVFEVSCRSTVFADAGDGLYAAKLLLDGEPVSVVVSRLREVHVEADTFGKMTEGGENKDLLSNVRLQYALVEDVRAAQYMGLTADTVAIPLSKLSWSALRWLCKVRKLCLVVSATKYSFRTLLDEGELMSVPWSMLQQLAWLLDSFEGEVVHMAKIPITFSDQAEKLVGLALKEAINAADRFERRGGDAGSVRAVLAAMSTCFGEPR